MAVSKTKRRKRLARRERKAQITGSGITSLKQRLSADYESSLAGGQGEFAEQDEGFNTEVQGGTRAFTPEEGE